MFMYSLLKRALVLSLISLVSFAAHAQKSITGNVVDASGEPMIGVTIMVDGKAGAITDFDGNFSLSNVTASTKMKISYIGYKDQIVTVGAKSDFKIVLEEDDTTLSEVVVVGYGTMKKSDVTGSVSSVSSQKLNAKGATSVLGNLQGTSPGVNISQSSGRTNGGLISEIRGKASINSDTSPLFVVDGVMCSDIDWLNPQDIERIDVLKDASSTAIYGSRATAGVIMVTTKGGLNVSKAHKATISYDGYYGINSVARMPDFMNGQQFYHYRLSKFLTPVTGTTDSANPAYSFATQLLFGQALLQKTASDYSSDFVLKEMLASGETYDWPSLVTQDGSQQNHYVALSGSSETANYHFGVGLNKDEGISKGDASENYTFKGSVDAKINKFISGGFTVNMSYKKNDYAYDDAIKNAYRLNPFMIPYDSEGNINHYPGNKTTLGTDANQFSDFTNPLDAMQNQTKEKKTYRLLGNAYLQFDLMKGLYFKTTFSPTYQNYRQGTYTGYTNPVTGLTYEDDEAGTTSTTVINYTSIGYTWDNVLNYSTTIKRDHSINAMALYSMEHSQAEKYTVVSNNVIENTAWYNIGSGELDSSTSSSFSESAMISYALRLNYSYKGKYMVTGTVRWDGSSKFADGYRWGSFPSMALAWRMSEEKWLQKNWLTDLKLRLSYGVTGNNAGIGNYATIVGIGGPTYYPFGSTYVSGYYPSDIVDKLLSWEKSYEWNLGLDYGFLRNRISGAIDVYRKDSKDLLYSTQLPLVAGGSTMTTNVGQVRNTGVECSINTVNIDNKSWNWTTSLTFAHNNNVVRKLDAGESLLSGSTTGNLFVGYGYNNAYGYVMGGISSDKTMVVPDNAIAVAKGFTPGTTVRQCDYLYACYGIYEGQPYVEDLNGDGAIDENDKKIYNCDPDFTGSFTSSLSYTLPKNAGELDFSVSLYASVGGTVYSPFMTSDYYDYHDRGRGKMTMDYYIAAGTIVDANGMRSDGTFIDPVYQTTTHYANNPFPNNGDSDGLGVHADYFNEAKAFVDASYLKVKNITLGYTFSKNLLKKISCQSCRVYLNITNPFVFTKYKGFDPEWATAALKNDGPSVISYQIGANIKF